MFLLSFIDSWKKHNKNKKQRKNQNFYSFFLTLITLPTATVLPISLTANDDN